MIHCENPHIVVFTSHHALPHYKLDGCRRIKLLLGRLLRGARAAEDRAGPALEAGITT